MTQNGVLTVGELRKLIVKLPDDHQIWTLDEREHMFAPAVWAMADKRNRSVTLSIRTNE